MTAPTYRSGSFAGAYNGGTTRVINKPAGTVEGDLLVAMFFGDEAGWFDNLDQLTPPAGWITVNELISGNVPAVGLYYKIAGASEPASYTWTLGSAPNTVLLMACIETGTFDADHPISGTDFSRQFQPTTSASVSAPSMNTRSGDSLGLAFFGSTASGRTWTAPSGWTEQLDTDFDGWVSGSIHTKTLASGATGTVTATASGTVAANGGAGALVAVRPASGATAPPAPLITQFAQVSDWFQNINSNTRTITGVNWQAGDIIVVIGGIENAQFNAQISTVTNANLTFTKRTEQANNDPSDPVISLWTATAGSSQTNQTITVNKTGGFDGDDMGAAVWVVTGNPSGTANITSNLTESAISRTVSDGSVVIHGLIDWNATNPPGKTPLTGSGTATERRDNGNGSNYAQWLADWTGVSSGTFSFGPNNYTSLKVAQAIIEVQAASVTAPAAITDLAATPATSSVQLAWTAPSDGGSAITDYEYRVNGGTWTSTGSTSPSFTVTGLTNGVEYDFEVRAVNVVGAALASNLVNATPRAINANHLTADWHAGNSDTTASITPTAGAGLFALVLAEQGGDVGDDIYEIQAEFTVSGLGGTWTEVAAENGPGGARSWALFYCDDWSGSGSLTVTYTHTGIITSLGWIVTEVMGLSPTVPYIGLTRSVEGLLNASGSPALTIGDETIESVPTNAATISWMWSVYDDAIESEPDTSYDTANWSLLVDLDEVNDNNNWLSAIFSASGDPTPGWTTPLTDTFYDIAIGLILVAEGNEPAEYKQVVLRMDESKQGDGVAVSSFTNWSAYQAWGSGVATIDTHHDHAPSSRVIDMSNTGEQRLRHSSQIGSNDHWASAVYFFDKYFSNQTPAINKFHLYLRMQSGTASATDNGYQIEVRKVGVTNTNDYNLFVYSMASGTPTQVATAGPFFSSEDDYGIDVYAEIKGSVIKVYTEGTLRLTHDTTGDGTVYSTGQYVGVGQDRDLGDAASQPFFYRWRAGTFETIIEHVATIHDDGDANLTYPGGLLTGDFMVATVRTLNKSDTGLPTAPDGNWTQQGTVCYNASWNSNRVTVFTAFYDSASPPSLNFAQGGHQEQVQIEVFRNVDETTPVDLAATDADVTWRTVHTFDAGHTPSVDGCMIVQCVTPGSLQDVTFQNEPSLYSVVSSNNATYYPAVGYAVQPAAQLITPSFTLGTYHAFSGVILALRPGTFATTGGSTPSGDATVSFGFSSSTTASGVRTRAVSSSWGFSTSTSNSTARDSTASQSWGFTGTAESSPVASGSASLSWGFSSVASNDSSRESDVSVSWGISASVTVEAVKIGVASLSWGFQTSVSNETIRARDVTTSFGFTYGVTHNEVAVRSINFSWGFFESATNETVRDGDVSTSWGDNSSATGSKEVISITDYIVQYRTTAGPGVWQTFNDGVNPSTGATVTGLDPGVSYDFRVAAVNEFGQGEWSNIATVVAGGEAVGSGGASASFGFSATATGSATKSSDSSVSFGFSETETSDTIRELDVSFSFGFAESATSGSTYAGDATASWGFSATATFEASRSLDLSVSWGHSEDESSDTVRDSDVSTSWGFIGTATAGTTFAGDATASWGFNESETNETIRNQSASDSNGFSESVTSSVEKQSGVSLTFGFSTVVEESTVRDLDVSRSWGWSQSATTEGVYAGSGTQSWGFSASTTFSADHSSDASVSWSNDEAVSSETIRGQDSSTSWSFSGSATSGGTFAGNATASWGFSSDSTVEATKSSDSSASWRFIYNTTRLAERNGVAFTSWGHQASLTLETLKNSDVTFEWGHQTHLTDTTQRDQDASITFGYSAWGYAGDSALLSRVFLGSNRVTPMYVGQNLVLAAYLGSNKIY